MIAVVRAEGRRTDEKAAASLTGERNEHAAEFGQKGLGETECLTLDGSFVPLFCNGSWMVGRKARPKTWVNCCPISAMVAHHTSFSSKLCTEISRLLTARFVSVFYCTTYGTFRIVVY